MVVALGKPSAEDPRTNSEVRGRLTMRQIVHAYLPKAKRSKAEKPAAAKPAVIVTTKSVKQVDKDKRIARGY